MDPDYWGVKRRTMAGSETLYRQGKKIMKEKYPERFN
jgi:hypothetical protein